MEDIIPGRKRIRFMEADAAHGGRNRKRHLNVIVERGVVIALTEVAVEMRVQFAQASEALDNVGAHWTDQQPVHVEQPNYAGMEEKIDAFSFGNRFLCGELDRIDAVECLVRARAQQHLQPRDDARTPGFGRLERDQALLELFFVDHRITPRQNLDHPWRSVKPKYSIQELRASPSG